MRGVERKSNEQDKWRHKLELVRWHHIWVAWPSASRSSSSSSSSNFSGGVVGGREKKACRYFFRACENERTESLAKNKMGNKPAWCRCLVAATALPPQKGAAAVLVRQTGRKERT
ncbi:hypothetical protein E2C01_100911 [Portunus trituberculatus]|uniref:Uncharacterized protein n=1 Tax=Portunus trituberculatus TaxID=210409 RepID=A0A5B7KDE5_PORTR|nr:hypothetical protein [Portunus trituberculatus]